MLGPTSEITPKERNEVTPMDDQETRRLYTLLERIERKLDDLISELAGSNSRIGILETRVSEHDRRLVTCEADHQQVTRLVEQADQRKTEARSSALAGAGSATGVVGIIEAIRYFLHLGG